MLFITVIFYDISILALFLQIFYLEICRNFENSINIVFIVLLFEIFLCVISHVFVCDISTSPIWNRWINIMEFKRQPF